MSVTLLLTVYGLVYAISLVLGAMLSLHAARSWHAAYWCGRPLSRWATWHPLVEAQRYDALPTQAPSDAQLRAFLLLAIIPVVNTVVACYVLLVSPAVSVIGTLRHKLGRQDERKASA